MRQKHIETDSEKGKAGFLAKAALLGSLMVSGCSPDVVIRNKYYDPNADARTDMGCTTVASCAQTTVYLREDGSKAGSNTATIGGATLRLLRIEDSGSTKAAVLEVEGCQKKAEGTFLPGSTIVLSIGKDSVLVKLESLDYDASGLRLKVSVEPVCAKDGGMGDMKHDSRKDGA